MAAISFQPEWPSDESGNVELIDENGRCCKYRLSRLFKLGEALYTLLIATSEVGQQILACEYLLDRDGGCDTDNAWRARVKPLDSDHIVARMIERQLLLQLHELVN